MKRQQAYTLRLTLLATLLNIFLLRCLRFMTFYEKFGERWSTKTMISDHVPNVYLS